MPIYNPNGGGAGGAGGAAMPLTDGRMWFTERQLIVPAGGTDKAMFRTGATPVLMKQREFRFKGLRVSFVINKAPTISNTGVEDTNTVFNVSPAPNQTRQFRLYPTPTVTNDGVSYTPSGSFQGDISTPIKQSCFPVLLEPNTDYLFVTTNLDSAGAVDLRVRAVFIETTDDVSSLLLDNRVEL